MAELKVKLVGQIGKISISPPKLDNEGLVKSDGKLVVPVEMEMTDLTRAKLADIARLCKGQLIDVELLDPQYELPLKANVV